MRYNATINNHICNRQPLFNRHFLYYFLNLFSDILDNSLSVILHGALSCLFASSMICFVWI